MFHKKNYDESSTSEEENSNEDEIVKPSAESAEPKTMMCPNCQEEIS